MYLKDERLYKSDISTVRWIAYDLPGNVGWILYFVGLILLFGDQPEYMSDAIMTVLAVISIIPAILMLVGIAELISERIHKLDWTLPRMRLLRGFGALTLGGIIGTAIAAVMLIFTVNVGTGDLLYIGLMLAESILCGLFAGLIFKRYKPVNK